MINKSRLIREITKTINLFKEMSVMNDYNNGFIEGMMKVRDIIACYKERSDSP